MRASSCAGRSIHTRGDVGEVGWAVGAFVGSCRASSACRPTAFHSGRTTWGTCSSVILMPDTRPTRRRVGGYKGKKSLCTQNGPLIFGSPFNISIFPRGIFIWFRVCGWFGLGEWDRPIIPPPPPPPREGRWGGGGGGRMSRAAPGRARVQCIDRAIGGGMGRAIGCGALDNRMSGSAPSPSA